MSQFFKKYATACHVRIPIVKRGVVDFAVSADWTPSAGDVKLVIDGAAAANITSLPTAIATANTGTLWDFSFTSGEITGKEIVVVVSDAATKAIEDQSFSIATYGNASAEIVFDLSVATQTIALPTGAAPTAVPGDTANLSAKIDFIMATMKFKATQNRSTGLISLFRADGSTLLGSATATDDGTTLTRGAMS